MLERIHHGVDVALFWLAGVALVAMMVLVSVDVVARYLFNAPLTFQFELTTNYLMVMVATLALPWCERRGSFIRLSVIGRWLGVRGHNLLHAFNAIAAALVLAAIAWFSGVRTLDKYLGGDAMFGVIDWPVWLSTIWVPVGCGMLSLRLVVDALRRLLNLDRRVDGHDERVEDARDIAEHGGRS
ncbi:TRAP transporter small permease [Salinisphaera sp. T31B1]|uniref:TRAP transporter small permease n=1 Tax=Salinisphaera sp. T31B1 TaxID=727963 RepID=UPI00333F3006